MSKRRIPPLADAHRSGVVSEETAAVREARKALAKRKGKPDAADAPPPSTFPGPKPRELPGQLSL